MKKIIFLAINMLAFTAEATESLCGYRDYFHLDDKTHPQLFIAKGNNTRDISLQIIGPRSFEIRDLSCKDGYAHITVAYDTYHWCLLDIKDGPYMMHPTTSASCHGMSYKGITYDGFNTYSYTITFD